MENENEMEAKFHIIPAINNNDYEIIFKNPQIMSQIKRFIFNAIFICAFYLLKVKLDSGLSICNFLK